MPKAKPKEKHLHFAGYDFTSGSEGTVVHRPTPERAGSGFQPGDRVEYRDVNLWQQGTVTGADGKWVMVRWDGRSFESREWAPNLRHASTASTGSSARHHATKKKSPAQLQREINEALSKKPGNEPCDSFSPCRGNYACCIHAASTPGTMEYKREARITGSKRSHSTKKSALVSLPGRPGFEVLAKETKHGPSAYTFANRAQAERKASEIGNGFEVYHWGRPWFVARNL